MSFKLKWIRVCTKITALSWYSSPQDKVIELTMDMLSLSFELKDIHKRTLFSTWFVAMEADIVCCFRWRFGLCLYACQRGSAFCACTYISCRTGVLYNSTILFWFDMRSRNDLICIRRILNTVIFIKVVFQLIKDVFNVIHSIGCHWQKNIYSSSSWISNLLIDLSLIMYVPLFLSSLISMFMLSIAQVNSRYKKLNLSLFNVFNLIYFCANFNISHITYSWYLYSVPADLITWWRHQMETFSALLPLCEGNPPVLGGFPSQRPMTRSFDAFFDLRSNKWLSKQSRCWWFETPSHSISRHCNDVQHVGDMSIL